MDGECVLPGAYYVCAALRRGATLQNAGFHRYLSLHERFVGNPNGGTQVGVTPREWCFVSKISKVFPPIGVCMSFTTEVSCCPVFTGIFLFDCDDPMV